MLTKEQEYEIVKDVLNGKTEEYAVIVNEYQQHVANLVYKLVLSPNDVEEIVQQVFVDLYMSLPRFRFESRLSTYIYRITVNVVANMLRRQKKYVSLEHLMEEERDRKHNQEETIIHEERMAMVRRALGNLKTEQRTALVLYSYEGFSYQDISDVMQISLAKVESLIFRARKNIKKQIEAML